MASASTNGEGLALGKLKAKVVGLFEKVKKTGVDDPRRITHSMKMGLALTVVSVIYCVNPIYDGFGGSMIWALLTVVFVMEFTVGGTLGKGLNRAFATMVAGALGVGAHYLAVLAGVKGEPVLLGLFVFLMGAAATFARFVPDIKKKYDYGVLIFILTFSLVTVSSYRVDEIIELAHQRLSTVAIGGATCMMISVCIFPVWAGGDLHGQIALHLEKLGQYLQGLESEYFVELEVGAAAVPREKKALLPVYKSVLNAKATEESLAGLARWEPGHGRFKFRHPWKQYLQLGALARQCACSMEALNAHVTTSDIFLPASSSSPDSSCLAIRDGCREICSESSKALKDLSSAIRLMTDATKADIHVAAACTAVADLKEIPMGDGGRLSEIMHAATVASVLAEIVVCVEMITKSTNELARSADFKSTSTVVPLPRSVAAVNPISDEQSTPTPTPPHHLTITIEK